MAHEFTHSVWRLVVTPPASGPWNMAVDEGILESYLPGTSVPTIRFFFWEPPCLSLGVSQPSGNLVIHEIESRKWDLVRRPTGGRAILHTDELTYSVIAPITEPRVHGSILESYQSISSVLVDALQGLGVNASADMTYPDSRSASQKPVCFETPSNYEITVDGKKILGSAQMRKGSMLLQHGSLPLRGDLTRINSCFLWDTPAKRSLADEKLLARAVTLAQVLGYEISTEQVEKQLVASFEKKWNLSLQPEPLTENELKHIDRLEKEKYSSRDWNFRI